MLVQFTVENFRTIFEKKTFSMQTAPYLKKFGNTNTFNSSPINLLKSAVMFGPNGSGKTNIIKAIDLLKNMIINSYRINATKSVKLPFQPFKMSQETKDDEEKGSTLFEITLLLNNKLFEYKINYNKEMILMESLKVLTETTDKLMFRREFDDSENKYVYEIGENFPDYQEKTKKNVLYLTVLSEFDNDFNQFEGKEVYNWFLNDLIIIEADDDGINNNFIKLLDDEIKKENLLEFLKIADFNIVDIDTRKRITEVPEHLKALMVSEFNHEVDDHFEFTDVYTIYNKYDSDGQISGTTPIHVESYESRGTIKMINLALILLDATENSRTIFIDEFDNALHYEISVFLLKLFNSELHNKKSQFIINTHDLSLLDSKFLRIDQIWFSEKNKSNITDFYSLYDINLESSHARSDLSYAKKYMKGKFGAVPIINESMFNFNFFNKGDKYGTTK